MKVEVMIGIDRFDRGVGIENGIIDISIVSASAPIDAYPSVDAYPKLLTKGTKR